MSYHIIKSIVIKEDEGKVYITGADNNVYPRTPHRWECTSLSRILTEQGHDAVELEIFEAYESGNFQGGSNKWTRALTILRHLPEYKDFDWRCGGLGEEFDKIQARRNTDDFKALLKKALNMKVPKEKFIISKLNGLETIYMRKLTKKRCFWTRERAEAKTFHYSEDAERVKGFFFESEHWKVEHL